VIRIHGTGVIPTDEIKIEVRKSISTIQEDVVSAFFQWTPISPIAIKQTEQTDNENNDRNRLPNVRIRKTAITLPAIQRLIENDWKHNPIH